MTVATPYRMLNQTRDDSIIPKEDAPIIGQTLDARALSYDMALALRTESYSMTQFIDDLVLGNITAGNVEMRRHFVMRDMADTLGVDIDVADFEAMLLERVTHGTISKSKLAEVDEDVLRTLKLHLALA